MTKARKPRKQPHAKPADTKYPIVFETYQKVDFYDTSRLTMSEPYTGNGMVRIRRYRITVELIDEPIEVLRDRLLRLWRESERNLHIWRPMDEVAEELGMGKLPVDQQGIDHKKAAR